MQLSFKQPDEYQPGEVILFSEQIQQRIAEVAGEIATDYNGKELIIVGLLRGACVLTTDLITTLHAAGLTGLSVDFMMVKSYGKGTQATHAPEVMSDICLSVKDETVLVVDDIVDTGKTMEFVTNYLKKEGAKEVRSFTLLDKPSRRKVAFVPDYVGFTIPDIWVQGYGMDTDEKGRGDKNIIKGPYTY